MIARFPLLVWQDQFKTTSSPERTGANRGYGEGKENLCFLRSLLFNSGPGGVVELDFDKSISDGVNIFPNYQLSNPQPFRNCANTKPSMS